MTLKDAIVEDRMLRRGSKQWKTQAHMLDVYLPLWLCSRREQQEFYLSLHYFRRLFSLRNPEKQVGGQKKKKKKKRCEEETAWKPICHSVGHSKLIAVAGIYNFP
jgi:hypothetical protein